MYLQSLKPKPEESHLAENQIVLGVQLGLEEIVAKAKHAESGTSLNVSISRWGIAWQENYAYICIAGEWLQLRKKPNRNRRRRNPKLKPKQSQKVKHLQQLEAMFRRWNSKAAAECKTPNSK